ncbi:serine hydroxymethyltransferase [Candidatus Woesearchaeota archaeon]|nr:serine hydroxymethyltransferase [Candidatus Woesearchaeota archaeon]
MRSLHEVDPATEQFVQQEQQRQETSFMMIPSENSTSRAVMQACGSTLINKYAEGYPAKRYYEGNAVVDAVENLAIERAKKLFGAEHVNVQPYSGSPANLEVYYAVLKPGDKILGMQLNMGGHLTHGHGVNFSAKFYKAAQYVVDPKTHLLDMDAIRKLAHQEKPNIIVSGATAYPRIIDFKQFHEIAEEVGAYSFADISHIAGLIAGGAHPSPFPFTDLVMTTTHKTLRGPRGAMIMCKKLDRLAKTEGMDEKQAAKEKDLAGKVDRAVFPALQGGPHENIIAGKAVAFHEALQPEFKEYAHQIVKNAKALAAELMSHGVKLVTDGTDNHLLLIDLTPTMGIGMGKPVAAALADIGLIMNYNTVPYDQAKPFNPSGIRLGTPGLTTRGMKEKEMKDIGHWMAQVIKEPKNDEIKQQLRKEVLEMTKQFPLYG